MHGVALNGYHNVATRFGKLIMTPVDQGADVVFLSYKKRPTGPFLVVSNTQDTQDSTSSAPY